MEDKIKAQIISGIVSSNSSEAFELFSVSRFGEKSGEKILYSLSEAFFLIESGKMTLYDFNNKKISKKDILKKFDKFDKKFFTKYLVFKDLRSRGYIVKTALKFGAEFRVYDKKHSVGENHAKWILFPVSENDLMTWHDFSAKNRVAHSTKKNLLIAIVDEEGDVSYYEVNWIRP